MSSILNYFFKPKGDRSASLPRADQAPEESSGKRDASVPPALPKNGTLKKIDYNALDSTKAGYSPNVKQSIFEPKSNMFRERDPPEPPRINLPLANELPKIEMLDPEITPPKPVQSSTAIGGPKPIDYKMEVPVDQIKAKLLEASDRFYPRSFPHRESEPDFFSNALVSHPISAVELQKAIDNSAKYYDRDGQNLKKFMEIKKEIEFCKKYLRINEAKKSKVREEIQQLRGPENSSMSAFDTSMNADGLAGETLELRLAKERLELDRLRSQVSKLNGTYVEFSDRVPRQSSIERTPVEQDTATSRLPSIFPDNQGVAKNIDLGSMNRYQSTFVPIEQPLKIQRPKNNPLITKIN